MYVEKTYNLFTSRIHKDVAITLSNVRALAVHPAQVRPSDLRGFMNLMQIGMQTKRYACTQYTSCLRLAEYTILDLNIRIIFACIRIYAYVRIFGHPQIEISLLCAPN